MYFLFSLFFVPPLLSSHFPLGLRVFPIFLFSMLFLPSFFLGRLFNSLLSIYTCFPLSLVNISINFFSLRETCLHAFISSPQQFLCSLVGLKDLDRSVVCVFTLSLYSLFIFPALFSPSFSFFSPVPPFSFLRVFFLTSRLPLSSPIVTFFRSFFSPIPTVPPHSSSLLPNCHFLSLPLSSHPTVPPHPVFRFPLLSLPV